MSTPEERIALREVQGSRWQKTGRMLLHAKGNQRAAEWSKTEESPDEPLFYFLLQMKGYRRPRLLVR